MSFKKRIVHILLFLFCGVITSQELPPIVNFSTDIYGAGNQNWAISQGDNGHIYVANHNGLLEFNGAQWTLYNTPNQTIMRSVKAVGDRIYTGCYMEFGYWEYDAKGILNYTNLSEILGIDLIEDEQFWNILALDEFVTFQSLNSIYIYNTVDKSVKNISTGTTLTKMYLLNDTIYFQEVSNGLFEIVDGRPKLVSADPIAKKSDVVNIITIDDQLIIQTQKNGFYTLNDTEFQKYNFTNQIQLEDYTVYSSISLRNGNIALGTISNGIIIMEPDGTLSEKININNGLSNNTVLSLFEDTNQNLWLALDNGIDCLNLASPIKRFSDGLGQLGTVYASALFEDYLYLGTNQGLFYKPYNSDSKFKLIEGTSGQVWCLNILNNSLFAGHNVGTFQVSGDKAKLISNVPGTWEIQKIDNRNDLLLQGNFSGLHILEKDSLTNNWSYRNKLNGFDNSSRYFEQLGTTFFVSHEYKGVYKIEVDANFINALSVEKLEQVQKGKHAGLQKFDNRILYGSPKGVFIYNPETESFEKNATFSKLLSKDGYTSGKLLVDQHAHRLWCFSKTGLKYLEIESLSGNPDLDSIPIPSNVRKEMTGFESLTHLENSKYLIGSSKGYLIFDLKKFEKKDYQVEINRVERSLNNESKFISLNDRVEFENSLSGISFNYNIPEFNHYRQAEYQYRLLGHYEEWSQWSNQSYEVFKNLPSGNYTFEVRGRIGYTLSNNIDRFDFNVAKPWYLTNLMILLYAFGVIFFSIFMHHVYKRYYKRQRQKLIEKNQRVLELKALENEQELMKLKNDKLQQDIASKNRELAISTMSLIKKNEFLSDIKEKLKDKGKDKSLNNVIKVIDSNLNNNDDWKLFEEAFNNADKDFLKKVKTKHPSLTSNDLRLCAYLRLNLTSKEIAPLLNISPRSVEVKRYRLRKKMDLPHEENLTNYILEI